MKLYLLVSNDDLQLPMIIDPCATNLAEKLGIKKTRIFNALWLRAQNPNRRFYPSTKYIFDVTDIPDNDAELVTDEMWEHYKRWKYERRKVN